MSNRVFVFIGFFFWVFVSGQTASTVLAGISKHYSSSKPLQYNTKYNLFKDNKSKVVHQSYSGFFQKNSVNDIYMKIDETEFVNNNKIRIKISHNEKAIMIENKQEHTTGDFDINKLLVFCTISSFKDYKEYWEIVLLNRQYSNLEYSKIVVNVNKDYTLRKQVFYYNTEMNFSKDYRKQEMGNPRLEIDYNYYSNKEISSSIFNIFFTLTKDNRIILSTKYKGYEIEDNRNNKIN
jgi:hypothetical protein